MLKSCTYCGRIHDSKIMCLQKQQSIKDRWNHRVEIMANNFRHTSDWKNKSQSVRQRDCHMCLCCKALLPGTVRQYNQQSLSVHHIVPIAEDYDLRLDEYNLITVCALHHEMCEAGKVTRDKQRELVAKIYDERAK